MKRLLDTYGRLLTAGFALFVALWALGLIILPQVSMLERALTAPKRQLDSSSAGTLGRDANLCVSILRAYDNEPITNGTNGGLAIPSISGISSPSASSMTVPSMGVMAVPSIGTQGGISNASKRPYILQCDRADTHQRIVRSTTEVYLDELYNLPILRVDETQSVAKQIEVAQAISELAFALETELKMQEAQAFSYTLDNFGALFAARYIPMLPEAKRIDDAKVIKKIYTRLGLRFENGGEIYERIGAITLFRTLCYAMATTLLALLVCYPVASTVALATKPERAVWMMLALIIPYAIVELMRVYAWTTIIDNRGLLNSMLDFAGFIDMQAGESIQFKRSALTVFIVIVYTYVLFMVFPILNVMSTLDRNQIDAAKDLGASTFRIQWRIVIPHSKPGIAVGSIATFMLAAGAFSVPRIISRGLQSEWFSQSIYNKFFESENSNVGAAYSFGFTLICFVIVALFMWIMRTRLKDFAKVQS